MFSNIEDRIMEWSPDIIQWNVERKYGHLSKEQLLGVIAQMKLDSIKDKINFVKTRYKDSLKESIKKDGLLSKIHRKWEELKFKNKKVDLENYCKNGEIDDLILQYAPKPEEEDKMERGKVLIGRIRESIKASK